MSLSLLERDFMSKIQVLDQGTINQIAAGEVIDRPASVVKELMENAIDALATAITVEIKDGGVSFIRITDNGSGIAKDDIETAFLRHATSKIKSAIDLITVSSLGFRGEALSSIAAVAMVELITKQKDTLMGAKYEIEGGRGTKGIEDVGVPDGTTFIIRNLFFNTPARRKFLKSAATEAGYISDIVWRMALSHPEVSIRFINNGKHLLHTNGNGNLKDVIYAVYGREITSNLIEINRENENIKVSGFIGKPLVSRGNRTYENYFINGRYIKSALINKAIEEGYKSFIMQHKYPFTALHFEVKPELIDVNVHPSKMELRFRNQEEIYPFIINSISDALSGRELIPEVSVDEKESLKKAPVLMKTPEFFEAKRIVAEEISYNSVPKVEVKTEIKEEVKQYSKEVVKTDGVKADVIRQDIVKQDVIKSDIVKLEVAKEEIDKTGIDKKETTEEDKNKAEIAEIKEGIKEDVKEEVVEVKNNEQITMFDDDKFLTKKSREHHVIVGQVFDTYWIVQYGDKMFIIDQHAAHEKVLYERMIKKLKNRNTLSQNINPPIILNLTIREAEIVKDYNDYLSELGYEMEEFGGNDFAVRAVPFDLFSIAKKELLMEIIDGLTENANVFKEPTLILEKVASMSCKAAVKGNNKLSMAEANALIEELLSLENPYNCPHGRPTIVSMSKYEIEKKFKRII